MEARLLGARPGLVMLLAKVLERDDEHTKVHAVSFYLPLMMNSVRLAQRLEVPVP